MCSLHCIEKTHPNFIRKHAPKMEFNKMTHDFTVGDSKLVLPATLAIMRMCPLFANINSSLLETICREGKRRLCTPGQQIIFAGERSCSMFLVCSGKVSCHVDDTQIKTLGVGESFGDIAIYFDYIFRVYEEHASILGDPGALSSLLARTADIVGVEHGVLMELSAKDLSKYFVQCPRLVHNVVRIAEAQLAEACANGSGQALEARRVVEGLHPFVLAGFVRALPSDQVSAVLQTVTGLHRRRVCRLHTLVEQGDVGDSVFLILSGLYSCQVNGREVRQFGPWEMFGEVSLCASFPDLVFKCLPEDDLCNRLGTAVAACGVRTADVVCIEEGDVIEIPATQIVDAFRCSHQLFENMYGMAEQRFLEAVAAGSIDAILRYQG
mmetsp:Transcript_35925/g.75140  ORF Transcript_35925/g.75140 Transcript_35925/m.75140 type:complete len:381 (-) Transcript_35925:50-1192(-)